MFIATKRYECEFEEQTLFGDCDFLQKNDGIYFRDTKRYVQDFGPYSSFDVAEVNARIVLSKGMDHFEWLNIPDFINKEFVIQNQEAILKEFDKSR